MNEQAKQKGLEAEDRRRLFEEKLSQKISKLASYCMRMSDVDTRNAAYQAMVGKFMSIMVAMGAAQSFETP